jgi:hypothetical protein
MSAGYRSTALRKPRSRACSRASGAMSGIVAKSVLDVTATAVANRLALYAYAEITNTGRRLAGRE